MSGSNRAKITRRRMLFTGEKYQHAREQMQQWRDGHSVIPAAADDAQQFVESVVFHRLLLGARSQWPDGVAPVRPLFVSAAHLSLSALRLEIHNDDVREFGAALAARTDSGSGLPVASPITVGCSPADPGLLVVRHSPEGGRIEIRCHWNDLRTAQDIGAVVSVLPGTQLHFGGQPDRMSAGDRATLSGLLRRIALFAGEEPVTWLLAWHAWMAAGRTGSRPAVPHGLARDLADVRLGLPVVQQAALGIGEAPLSAAKTRYDSGIAAAGPSDVQQAAPVAAVVASAAEQPVVSRSASVLRQNAGRRYSQLAVTALRLDSAHLTRHTFYVMRLPARWRQVLQQVRLSAASGPALLPRSSLSQSLEMLIPGCVVARTALDISDNPGWLYTESPVDPETILMVVTAWVRAQVTSERDVEHTLAQLRAEDLVWVPVDVDPRGLTSQQTYLIPMMVAAQLAESPYPMADAALQFRTSMTGTGAELISWPPQHLHDETPFSVTIGVSLQTLPSVDEPQVHLDFGVRRWAHRQARLSPGRQYSVFLDPARIASDETRTSGRLVRAPISVSAGDQQGNGRSWLPRWHPAVAGVLQQAGVLDHLPDPQQIVDEPLASLHGSGPGIALAFRTGMGWTKATPDLSVADRYPLMTWAASRLAPQLLPVEPLPRQPHTVYPGLSRIAGEVVTPHVLHQAVGPALTIELIAAEKPTVQATLDHLSARFGVGFPSADQLDRQDTQVAFGPVTITVRRPAGVDADILMDTSVHSLQLAPSSRTKHLEETVGPTTSPTITLIETTDFSWNADAKAKLRAALAAAGRISGIVTPAAGPGRPSHSPAAQVNLDSNRRRIGYAIDDLLRALGVRATPLPTPTAATQPALLAVWNARAGKLESRHSPWPIAVLCDPAGQQVTVRTPNIGWQPLHAAQLQLSSDTDWVSRMSEKDIVDFLRQVVDEATVQYRDTLLLTHAQNLRGTWGFLTNQRLTVDALGLGLDDNASPVSRWPGLRHVRVRTADGSETPQCYGINGDRTGQSEGLWRYRSPRLFGSTISKPAISAGASNSQSKLEPTLRNGRVVEPNPRAEVWNAEFVELFVAGLQDGDQPEHWAAVAHELRGALPYATWATTLPWPLHLANQLIDPMS